MTSPCNADCSFCSKSYRDVGPLVEGPGDVYICGECVELCQAIIDQEKRRRLSRVENPRSWPDPEMVRATLDRIGGLSGDICEALIQGALDHCADAERTAGDMVVMIGPARSSRLYAARALAHALEVPFGEADTARMAGSTLTQAFLDQLLNACDFDVKLAERGIVYIDAVDDAATQVRIVDLWDQSMRDPKIDLLGIDLTRILFVCGGTFAGFTSETGITKLGRHPEPTIPADTLGLAPALVRRVRVVMRVPLLDEATLTRLVPCIDFACLASDRDAGTG